MSVAKQYKEKAPSSKFTAVFMADYFKGRTKQLLSALLSVNLEAQL